MCIFALPTDLFCRGRQDIRAVWRRADRYVAATLRLHACSQSPTGTVTSGVPSPTLAKNIAMAYVQNGWHKKGTEVEVDVRNKLRKATLVPMPFYKPRFYRG